MSSFGEEWAFKLWDDGQFDLKINADPTHSLTIHDRACLGFLIKQFAELFDHVDRIKKGLD
jgi:hypothetical protein